jgi:hypothetical protein
MHPILLSMSNWLVRMVGVDGWSSRPHDRASEQLLFVFFGLRLTSGFFCRDELPRQQHSTQHRNRSEPTQLNQKPLQPKSRRSSSRELEVSRMRPVSPRLGVSCLLGASNTIHQILDGREQQQHLYVRAHELVADWGLTVMVSLVSTV